MARTPQEIFDHHAVALGAGDIDEIVADYADDAVFITSGGVLHGKDGVRQGFTALLKDLPNATWAMPTVTFGGDILFIVWSAVSGGSQVSDGVDTLVFGDDNIRAHTLHYTLEPVATAGG